MKTLALSALFACAVAGEALAWGQEGHAAVAEIAQRRLTPQAAAAVEQVLGRGHSLASVASWADDVRPVRPETAAWHVVHIPLDRDAYDAAAHCRPTAKGDCIVAELDRLKNDLRCAPTAAAKAEALKFAVHFVGDLHQPMHTLPGTGAKVTLAMRGLTCTGGCTSKQAETTLHAAWDSGLVQRTVWNWGALVERLESGWLKGSEAQQPGIADGAPADWAAGIHRAAKMVWDAMPGDKVLGDAYYDLAQPVIDRQLGLAGLRLAQFLNEAYASEGCPVR